MPDYICYCGKSFFIQAKQHKLLIYDTVLFCSVDCVLKYIQNTAKVNTGSVSSSSRSKYVPELWEIYDEITHTWYRSWYELYVARFLYLNNLGFLYESKFFTLGSKHYTPDFWLPDYDLYIEVKGIWGMSSKTKIRKVLKSDYHLILIPWHLHADFKRKYGKKRDKGVIR